MFLSCFVVLHTRTNLMHCHAGPDSPVQREGLKSRQDLTLSLCTSARHATAPIMFQLHNKAPTRWLMCTECNAFHGKHTPFTGCAPGAHLVAAATLHWFRKSLTLLSFI